MLQRCGASVHDSETLIITMAFSLLGTHWIWTRVLISKGMPY